MCATCESLGADDVDGIDMAGEPCAADLEVAAMAPHYEWRRARNARYLIYEGSTKFFGGVVVVVEAKRAATNIIDVRRLSPLDMMRTRLIGPLANE
jgi:hypothetical protein